MPNTRHYDFFIQAPNKKHGRKSFAIVQRQGKANKSLKLPEIDEINKRLKDGRIDFNTALDLITDIKNKLYAKHNPTPVLHSENIRLLKEYWEKRYEHKDIKDKESAYRRLRYALEAIDTLSLYTATQHELLSKISKHPQQRRVAAALNQMLKYVGRGEIRLALNRKARKKPRYLTPQELELVVGQIQHSYAPLIRTLCYAAMGTGLRLGELFALTRQNIRSQDGVLYLYISEQMGHDLKLDATKTRRDRTVVMIQRFVPDVYRWMDVPESERKAIRNLNFAKILKTACIKIFPDRPEKHCVFHDLRHSFAIELIRVGLPISTIALTLGNNALVCQEYYTGFSLTDEGIVGVARFLRDKADN